ncbi:MAG: hypothetical protein GY793_11320 [Proteobacteria bacterium]|nr:hypothetical protein [Pseudomonadota bacterium]
MYNVFNTSLKYIFLSFLLCFSLGVAAEEAIPPEVQYMITNFTEDLNSGIAREELKQNKVVSSPYTKRYSQKVSYSSNKSIKKAKFILDFKVISCQKDKLPDYLKDQAESHEACGNLDSRVIFKDTVEVFLTKASRFNNLKPTKLIRTVPHIARENSNYVIKDRKTMNSVKLGVELFAKPVKIVKNKVLLDLAVRTVELADSEEIYLDSNDNIFINNGINFKHRFLTASFPVALNSTEILGGNSAILSPKTDKLKPNSSYPENARLWLEVTLKPPYKALTR